MNSYCPMISRTVDSINLMITHLIDYDIERFLKIYIWQIILSIYRYTR